MSRDITITYELHPPPQVAPKGLSTTKVLSFPAPAVAGGEGASSKYYEALRVPIAKARDAIGDDLTAWRDAVGSLEQSKEPKSSKVAEDDEAEEEEESEE